MNLYSFLKNLHSGVRFLVLFLVLVAIIQAFLGLFGKKEYTESNRKLNLFAMISVHTQLLIGLALYFASPLVQFAATTMKEPLMRYWTVEHITGMIIAIAAITIGHSKAKKATTSVAKHRAIALFYTIALAVVVIVILQSGRSLFGVSR
jgi:hypothetical protein